MTAQRLQIGTTVKHDPSGIEGKVIATAQYEHDADQVCLQRKGVDNDGKPWSSLWYLDADCRRVPSPQ